MDLRALQAAILANAQAGALAITPEMGKVDGPTAHTADAQVSEIMRAAGFGATSRAIPTWTAKKLLIKRGKWRAIVAASENVDHPACDSAFAAVELANDARMDADFCDASAPALLQPLVVSGLLDEADVTALRDLCTVPSAVTAADVSRALRGPWE